MAESGGLDDFAAAQTARADTHALGRAIHERAHGLQVGLKPSWSHVVGVGNRPADNRTLVADLAPLGHKSSCGSLEACVDAGTNPRFYQVLRDNQRTGWLGRFL